APTRVVESAERRQRLGEEPGLHLFGNFQLLSGAALGFELLGHLAALRFEFTTRRVNADKPKGVPIHIFEAGEHSAPFRRLRRLPQHTPPPPPPPPHSPATSSPY